MNLAAIKELRGIPIGQVLTFDHAVGFMSVTTSVARLLEADPYRVAVTFSLGSTGTYFLGIDPRVSPTTGFPRTSFGSELVINDETHPGLAAMPWYVVAASTGDSLGWFTTRLIA